MFIGLKGDVWLWLSSQPTLRALTGAMLVQKPCGSGLDPTMQLSWGAGGGGARQSGARGGHGGTAERGALPRRGKSPAPLSVFDGGGGEGSPRPPGKRSCATGSTGCPWRQIQDQIDFRLRGAAVFTSSSTQPSGEHKQNERNERAAKVIVCAVTLQ